MRRLLQTNYLIFNLICPLSPEVPNQKKLTPKNANNLGPATRVEAAPADQATPVVPIKEAKVEEAAQNIETHIRETGGPEIIKEDTNADSLKR